MARFLVLALAQLARGQSGQDNDNADWWTTTTTTATAASAAAAYEPHWGKDACQDHGAIDIDTDYSAPLGLSQDECKARCDADPECGCVSFYHIPLNPFSQSQCFRRKDCMPAEFGIDPRYTTYVKLATSTTTTTTTAATSSSTVAPRQNNYTSYSDKRAAPGHGATAIDDDGTAPSGLSVDACKARCDGDDACGCVSQQVDSGKCWRLKACDKTNFESNAAYQTYVKKPIVPTASPTDSTTISTIVSSTSSIATSTSTTTSAFEQPRKHGGWLILTFCSLGAVLLVSTVAGFWYGRKSRKSARALEHQMPLFDKGADPEACLHTTTGTSLPEMSSQSPPQPAQGAADNEVGITARVEDEMIYFRVPGAATATVAGEWAWPGTALWHAMTTAPRHADGAWELGPMQQQLSPDFRVTVDGRMLQTSTQEALAGHAGP